ncbi:isocitrate lyase/PEP mutase family protein [Alphaproteobacteria bacterium]|jgi:2-methylisocitrate lyase-like PEP mutase family enzyme|nr:isocitrate lyase/PEP mutase family protein [Alphaproteobacteria bacterium]MDB2618169.1 isocitrate lyase/PEP mutase family protein [Alphaproteobacteria bacterium]MDC6452534.1 isocitrate lyase/PEP mutase family protein [Alphaproteobacteria bacterium]
MKIRKSQTEKLRELLIAKEFIPVPSCFDTLSAKLIEQANFDVTFMSGFAASASRIGSPDLGLMTFSEVFDQANNICNAINIPMIVDGDTGYGNAMNVRRTLKECAKAGCAGILIEDQLAPKRCGHTPGKDVVGRDEAFDRIRAANDMRNEGYDILIMARTDANHTHGLNEAIERAQKFFDLGADILFVEAPKNKNEMITICNEVPGHKIANIVEGGITPNLSMRELSDIGYKMAVYPLTVMSSAMKAMIKSLDLLMKDEDRSDLLIDFKDLRKRVGFDDYYEISSKYETSKRN